MAKKRAIWLVLEAVLLLHLIPNSNFFGNPASTATTLFADHAVVNPGQGITFFVWTYTSFDPVPSGNVRLVDLNTSQEMNLSISNGEGEIHWLPTTFVPGIHVFQATFEATTGYLASVATLTINFENFTSGNNWSTTLTLSANSSVILKDETLLFTIEVFISDIWYFEGGYLSVKALNFTGTPIIHTVGPLPFYYPDTLPTIFTYTFTYQVPTFTRTGINYFQAEYSGSSASQTQPSSSLPIPVQVESTGYWLSQTTDKTTVQRTEGSVLINTTILGDYPEGLILQTYYQLNDQLIIINEEILTERIAQTAFSPNSNIPLGDFLIHTRLLTTDRNTLLANTSTRVLIQDRARIDYTTNGTIFRPNKTIEFQVYVTEEDIWTHPLSLLVELVDYTDGNRVLSQQMTDSHGYTKFSYPIPVNASTGDHVFHLRTTNSPAEITDVVAILSLTIQGDSNISILYNGGESLRNSTSPIVVTVSSENGPLSEGFVSLEHGINQSLIQTLPVEPEVIFNYFIPATHPTGVTPYQIHFHGTSNYAENVKHFNLAVFTSAIFQNLGQNTSEVIQGEVLHFWGQLINDLGQSIPNEPINITNLHTGLPVATLITNTSGYFSYEYKIAPQTALGQHLLEITYHGNNAKFIQEETINHIFSFTIPSNPRLEEIHIERTVGGYEGYIKIDTDGLPIDRVEGHLEGDIFPFQYEALWKRWIFVLPISADNFTLEIAVFFPWDQEDVPSTILYMSNTWFAPQLEVESIQLDHQNLTFEVRVQKQSGKLTSDPLILTLAAESTQYSVTGTLTHESLTKETQIWAFSSFLPSRTEWLYSVTSQDIFGVTGILNGTIDATDKIPCIGEPSVQQIATNEKGGLVRIIVPAYDDFQIVDVTVIINGAQYSIKDSNSTHYSLDIWLEEGVYSINIVVTDDFGQVASQPLITFSVIASSEGDFPPDSSGSKPVLHGELIEIILTSTFFAIFIVTGNIIIKKKRDSNQ